MREYLLCQFFCFAGVRSPTEQRSFTVWLRIRSEAVAVVANGVEHQATLLNDAFLFQPSSGAIVSNVVARLADGSRVTVPLTASTLGG